MLIDQEYIKICSWHACAAAGGRRRRGRVAGAAVGQPAPVAARPPPGGRHDVSMPEPSAFTVLDNEEAPGRPAAERERTVNIVRPGAQGYQPPPPEAAHTLLDPKFSRALDFKLRRLKEKEVLQANLRRPTRLKCRRRWKSRRRQGRRSRGRKVSGSNDDDRPRFVTTVKTGQFLPPPPELACLLGLESLYPALERERFVYSYASKPKAVAGRPRRSVPADQPLPQSAASGTQSHWLRVRWRASAGRRRGGTAPRGGDA
ncbi:hypothetical protein ACJJTC_014710 [Scirpophaga incertulas]